MTTSGGRDVPKARRTQPSRIAVRAHIQDTSRRLRRRLVLVPDEGGVLAVRRPKSRGRTPRGGRLRRPQQAAFTRWVLGRGGQLGIAVRLRVHRRWDLAAGLAGTGSNVGAEI